MKTTKADIEQALRVIFNRFKVKLDIDWISNRPRILTADNQRYLSPRATKKEIGLWLDGFIEALELKRLK